MSEKTQNIWLKNHFDTHIMGRSSIKYITGLFEDAQTIFLNFEEVQSISRSAAHELLRAKHDLEARDINIIFTNISENISEMLDLVDHSIKSGHKSASYVKRVVLESEEDLYSFLDSV